MTCDCCLGPSGCWRPSRAGVLPASCPTACSCRPSDLDELYNLITILKPGQLKTPREFRRRFVVQGDPRLPKNRGRLRELLADVKGNKQIAVRSWELTDDGIVVTCQCEKWYRCPVDGTVLEPAAPSGIETQIEDLRREYSISARRVLRIAMAHGAPRQVSRVVLRGKWTQER